MIGLILMGIVFLGIYISISIKIFSGFGKEIHYVQNESMFGSVTLVISDITIRSGFIHQMVIALPLNLSSPQ
jgi:hypothetical protein